MSSYRSMSDLMRLGEEHAEREEQFIFWHLIRPVAPSLKEYMDPTKFGFCNDLYQLGNQRYGALFAMAIALLNRHETSLPQRPDAEYTDTQIYPCGLLGHWERVPLIMAHRYEKRVYQPGEDGLLLENPHSLNLFDFAGEHFTDISPAALAAFQDDRYLGYKPNPNSFRALIARVEPPRDDLTWMTIEDVGRLFNLARRRSLEFNKKLRSWLLRQKLSTATRRHLGGRPGRLLEAKKGLDDDRRHRRVKVRPGQDCRRMRSQSPPGDD